MIINATSHTIKKIWILFLFIVLFFVAFIATLMHGLFLESLRLPNVKIDQLYMKLDKKLIVNIQTLTIDKSTSADTSLEESALILENFPYLNQFFSHIDIQTIVYDNETFSLLYDKALFSLESKHLNVKARMEALDKHRLTIFLEEAFLKDFALHVNGIFFADLSRSESTFEGHFETFGIQGEAKIGLEKDLLSYQLQSEPFTHRSLSNLMNFLVTQVELEPIVKAWIHENIVAKEYRLTHLEGKFDLKTQEYFPLEMKGEAIVSDTNITFASHVTPAHADEIGIRLDKDTLFFALRNPIYEAKSLSKADIHIYNLLTKGTGIVVDLATKARLDASIHKILHTFKIDVPLVQTSGTTEASIKLDIRFLPYDLNATGLFKLSPSTFELSGLPMSTRSGSVELDNFNVKLNQTNLRYKNLFDIDTTGRLDTKTGVYDGKVDIHSLLIDFNGNTLLNAKEIRDLNGSFRIDDNATTLSLPSLQTVMRFGKATNLFEMSDLSLIRPLSPLMQEHNLSQGNLKLQTDDFQKFRADILLDNVDSVLIENNQTRSRFDIAFSTDGKVIDAYTKDRKLSVHYDKELAIRLKDINLSVPEGNSTSQMPIKTTISGENASFLDQNRSAFLLSDRYTLILFLDQTQLRSSLGKSLFNYDKKRDRLTINATAMDDNMTNRLFKKNYFKEGNFSLDIEGKDDKHMQGTFIMHKTLIKDLKFFNNLMATINAVPSLLVFNDPSFNKEGYFVENGYIEFSQEGEKMLIKELQLRGNNTDITGEGTVDFTAGTLDLNLQIKTLKTFSSALDKIPIVGGIILGEDGKIATRVNVKGSIDDPKVETHLLMDTIKSPVNVIKRTLELPLELFK
ncbi:AsmA-like C-terminal domain-containing protein [Sulfurospirillum sp. hDNRA2]|uniref:YhdP family protein n=1 Tax=Sulfurospirillum sp. hDNRA2 TaxID=3237298 RepID=UPI0020B7C049|nr:AsmA-like C-terminal domain-containing protein [Sulfurospirillum sp. DNRA8]MCP3651111.1 AsmA-like C-terminal domain-containing protein [Sulfurospirillum sp. DNRA8]MCR1809957.1 AsmA-like C-terminal domain-containing protein [Sulfurospirillum sp. DNRA8]